MLILCSRSFSSKVWNPMSLTYPPRHHYVGHERKNRIVVFYKVIRLECRKKCVNGEYLHLHIDVCNCTGYAIEKIVNSWWRLKSFPVGVIARYLRFCRSVFNQWIKFRTWKSVSNRCEDEVYIYMVYMLLWSQQFPFKEVSNFL